jgi:hypothetical protein
MNTYIVDSGNVTRKLKTPWVIDSGNVARKIKKIWVIDSGNVARLVFTGNTFTLTSGTAGGSSGYSNPGLGSLAPSNLLSDSNTIQEIASSNTNPHPLIVSITGSGISAGYLASIQFTPGSTLLGSAATFSGGPTSGQWNWSTGLSLAAGPYTVVITIT